MSTKAWLVSKAFAELALAGYVYDITPEEQQDVASNMELMVAEWLQVGINIGYSFAADTSAIDLNAESGVPLTAQRTVILGTAIATAASFGKQLAIDTRKAFAEGFGRLQAAAAMPREQQLPNTMPRGAGSKTWRVTDNPFMPRPDTAPLQIADDGGLQLGT